MEEIDYLKLSAESPAKDISGENQNASLSDFCVENLSYPYWQRSSALHTVCTLLCCWLKFPYSHLHFSNICIDTALWNFRYRPTVVHDQQSNILRLAKEDLSWKSRVHNLGDVIDFLIQKANSTQKMTATSIQGYGLWQGASVVVQNMGWHEKSFPHYTDEFYYTKSNDIISWSLNCYYLDYWRLYIFHFFLDIQSSRKNYWRNEQRETAPAASLLDPQWPLAPTGFFVRSVNINLQIHEIQ